MIGNGMLMDWGSMGNAFWMWVLDLRRLLRESSDATKERSKIKRIVTVVHNGYHFCLVEVDPWHNVIKVYDSMPTYAMLDHYHKSHPYQLISRELKRFYGYKPSFVINPMVHEQKKGENECGYHATGHMFNTCWLNNDNALHGDLTSAMYSWARWSPVWQRQMKWVFCQLYLREGDAWDVFKHEMLGGFDGAHEIAHKRDAEYWVEDYETRYPKDAIS